MAGLDAMLLRGLVARWSYRCGLHGKLGTTLYEVQVADGKTIPAPLVVAFASDLHAGPTTYPGIFIALAEAIRTAQPDLLLLGGDYVSTRAEHIGVLCETLAQCNPPLGKYAVLGNHDLWSDEEQIRRRLTMSGIRILVNENARLPKPFDSVSICGIDDPWTGTASAAETFKNAGPVRIFLTHSPEGLLLLESERFDVGFAGHTHGGQIALPNGTPIITAGGPLCRTHSHGRFDVAGNGSMIVSRGVGCTDIPVRINADPELVVCTLRPG